MNKTQKSGVRKTKPKPLTEGSYDKRITKSTATQKKQKRERQNAFLNALGKNGNHLTNACNSIGISRTIVHKWRKNEPDFDLKYREVKEGVIDDVEGALYKKAMDGNVTAQIYFLKTQGKNRGYVETIHNVNTERPIAEIISEKSKLSKKEQLAFSEIARKILIVDD